MKGLINFFIVMTCLFFSIHANAVDIHTPKLTIKRVEGASSGTVEFYSGPKYLGGWGAYSQVKGQVDEFFIKIGSSSTTIESVSGDSCSLDWKMNESMYVFSSECSSTFNRIMGKVYNVDFGTYSDRVCVQGGWKNDNNISTIFSDSGDPGSACQGYAPPPDCTGNECVCSGDDCLTPPEPSLSCSVKTSAINLAFGNMSMGSAAGETASGKVNVNCSKDGAKLTMSLKSGGSSIGLSNGMTTALTAGGNSLGSSISASKGDNSITVKGTLKGTEKEGVFSGSGVLVTDYQ